MTSMLISQPRQLAPLPPVLHEWLRRGSAAGLAVGLHAAAFALLLAGWQAEQAPSAQPPRTLAMQLVQLPPPAVEPPPVPAAAPVPAFEPPAPEIPQTSEVPPPVVDRAALARQRVEQERQQAQQRREQQQHLEQKRLEQERLLQQQAQAAEQARLEQQQALQREQQAAAAAAAAAERERQAQALASRQYLPISKEAPDYPDRALERGIEGDCTVRYRVNASGRVEEPQVVGDCHPLFVRPSLSAARTFRYQPRLIDGRAVPVEDVRNTFHYRIE